MEKNKRKSCQHDKGVHRKSTTRPNKTKKEKKKEKKRLMLSKSMARGKKRRFEHTVGWSLASLLAIVVPLFKKETSSSLFFKILKM